MSNCGIYSITNIVNGKVYIGSSNNMRRRYNDHISYLKRGVHSNIHLQRCFDKYGIDNFVFDVLEYVSEDMTRNDLFDLEQLYLDELFETKHHDFVYNMSRFINHTSEEYFTVRGEDSCSAVISNDLARDIKVLLSEGVSVKTISCEFHVTTGVVNSIKTLNSWVWLLPELNDLLDTRKELRTSEIFHMKQLRSQGYTIKEIACIYMVGLEYVRCSIRDNTHVAEEFNDKILEVAHNETRPFLRYVDVVVELTASEHIVSEIARLLQISPTTVNKCLKYRGIEPFKITPKTKVINEPTELHLTRCNTKELISQFKVDISLVTSCDQFDDVYEKYLDELPSRTLRRCLTMERFVKVREDLNDDIIDKRDRFDKRSRLFKNPISP